MRICYLNHDLENKTGAGRFGLSLLESLKNIKPNWYFRVLTHDDELPVGTLGWLFSFFRLRKIFKDFDVIHALDGWPYGLIAFLYTRGLSKKIIITTIGTGSVKPLYTPVKRKVLSWAYRGTDIITAISNNTKKEILKVLPYLKISVINHGVDAAKFQNSNDKLQIIDKIRNLKPYILSVGTLKKRKGYKDSIRAFAGLVNEFPSFKYVIVGEGPEREALEAQIKNYNLEDKVIFLRNISEEELISLYQNTEVFILLPKDSKHDLEGFGLVFLEAAASGAPVIATKESSAQDAVLDKENGFLVEAGDNKGATTALIKILRNKELKEKFSKNSIKFARHMNWEKAARSYLSQYLKK